jgi:hypothetical protein
LYSWITWITRVQNKCNFDYINLTFIVLDLGCEVSICTVVLLPSPEQMEQQFDYHPVLLRTEQSSLNFPSSNLVLYQQTHVFKHKWYWPKIWCRQMEWQGRDEHKERELSLLRTHPTATKCNFKHELCKQSTNQEKKNWNEEQLEKCKLRSIWILIQSMKKNLSSVYALDWKSSVICSFFILFLCLLFDVSWR